MQINKHHAKVSIVHSEDLKNQATGFNLPILHILNAWYRVVLAYLVHVHHRPCLYKHYCTPFTHGKGKSHHGSHLNKFVAVPVGSVCGCVWSVSRSGRF
jgi:hypothetical protein